MITVVLLTNGQTHTVKRGCIRLSVSTARHYVTPALFRPQQAHQPRLQLRAVRGRHLAPIVIFSVAKWSDQTRTANSISHHPYVRVVPWYVIHVSFPLQRPQLQQQVERERRLVQLRLKPPRLHRSAIIFVAMSIIDLTRIAKRGNFPPFVNSVPLFVILASFRPPPQLQQQPLPAGRAPLIIHSVISSVKHLSARIHTVSSTCLPQCAKIVRYFVIRVSYRPPVQLRPLSLRPLLPPQAGREQLLAQQL